MQGSSTESETRDPTTGVEVASDAALDNVVWSALTGAHAALAQRHGSALRYDPAFAPFGAAEDYSRDNVAQIAAMLKADERVALFSMHKPDVPAGLRIAREAVAIQMVATKPLVSTDDAKLIRPLGRERIDDMLGLVRLTEPGPFGPRTQEMGRYFGIWDGTRLIAMAGERMVVGRYVEVSAVCTHPDWRGQGLGRLLLEHLCASIQARGDVPFLHVFTSNAPAIRLYRELGFRDARRLHLTVLMR